MKKERFVKKDNGEYCDNNTGEILTAEGVITLLQKEKKRASELVSSEILKLRKENNILTRKDTHYFDWNTNRGNPVFFAKSYKKENKRMIKEMTANEMAMVYILTAHTESESNRIVMDDGKDITNKYLAEMLGYTSRTVVNIINSLSDKEVVAKVGKGRGRKLYLNPYISFDGKDIEKATLDIFGIKY